jgi:hypothetical protein
MSRIRRVGFFAVLLSIPVALGAFLVYMRQQPLTPEQQQGLQRMGAPNPPLKGRDASTAIWLLDLDVPERRREEAAQKIRAYEAAAAVDSDEERRDPREDWTKFPKIEEDKRFCDDRETDCLAVVEENRDAVAAALKANAAALASYRAVAENDGFRLRFPFNQSMNFPAMGTHRHLVINELALRYLAGETLPAMQATCHDLAGWRRIGGNSDFVMVSAVSGVWVRQDLMLLAEMLARQPDASVPAECVAALAPMTDAEYDLCPAARQDFESQRHVRRDYEESEGSQLMAWALDWRRLEARIAEDYSPFCGPGMVAHQRADERARDYVRRPPKCSALEELADAGCNLFRPKAAEDFGKFLDSRTDQAQALALMRTVLWLRGQVHARGEVAAALARRPADLGLVREPEYDAECDCLSMELHHNPNKRVFALALGIAPP